MRAIRAYQAYISPHKGFSCAYRCATGRDGCSGYGYRVIARFGLPAGLALLRRRLRLCGQAQRRRAAVPNPVLHYQRGDCDPECDGCDCMPDLPGNNTIRRCAADFFSNACSCDGWTPNDKKRKDNEKDKAR